MRNSRCADRLFRSLVIGVVLLVGACAPRIATHGNLPDPQKLAQVIPGKVNKDDVLQLLGSPSSIAAFNDETWYYISQRTETTAFLAPDTTARKVVVIHFNKKGIVSSVHTLGLADSRNVTIVSRTTPTAGKEMNVFQQILGNFGRFNTSNVDQQAGQ